MRVIRTIALIGGTLGAVKSLAEITSYRVAHPIAWMYSLPVGETPGWAADSWLNLELNQANIWNMHATVTDTRTGDQYTYKADFEQSTAVIDGGFAMGDWAFSAEVPYANHNGGFLDDFIDQFHSLGRFDRLLRDSNPKFDNSFIIQKNGEDRIDTAHAEGVGNVKIKLKWWMFPWRGVTPGACDCGLSLSTQATFPLQPRALGMSSARSNFSGLAHLGMPIALYSGVWATAAVTHVGFNETFAGWPQNRWQQMYELSMSLGLDRNLAVLLQARVESPLFDGRYLSFNHNYSDPALQVAEQVASGWNALVQWRGSEAAGLVWRWSQGSQVNFLIVEDWGLGDRDRSGSWNYVTDAPDVAFVTQWHFVF